MIYFVTLNYPSFKENEYLSKGYTLQNQARSFQDGVLKGFFENQANDCIVCLNCLSFPSFPKIKTISFKKETYMYYSIRHIQVPFINLPLIKHQCFYNNIKKFLIQHLKPNDKILFYSLFKPFLKLAYFFKKRGIESTVIVTDLPYPYCAPINNKLIEIKTRIINYNYKKYIPCIDKFVFLSKEMAIPLNVSDKQKTIVVEGIFAYDNLLKNESSNNIVDSKIIFYAGSLDYFTGIYDFAYAFHNIKQSDYKLLICGDGESKKQIKQIAANDKRVVYLGFLQKKKIIELIHKSTFLINPRKPFEDYTKYSFPSKTMDYLASGVPLFMYKLNGIPSEYDQYINYFDNNISLSENIHNMLTAHKPTILKKALNGQEFIFKKKNPAFQTKRIINLLDN